MLGVQALVALWEAIYFGMDNIIDIRCTRHIDSVAVTVLENIEFNTTLYHMTELSSLKVEIHTI